MCRAVTCRKCGQPSWRGCGAHVEQVLAHVPKSQRCQCKEAAAASTRVGWMRRIVGGRGDR
ncbi:MAG: hypothetical protein M0Z46_20320 [Actinomycetota bacterium]|nr:hypothetical protein [Actinomycetota bacterium]